MSLRSLASQHRLPIGHALWYLCSVTALASMLLSRAFHHAFPHLPPALDRALGLALTYQALVFFGVWIIFTVFLKVVVIGLVSGLLAFRKRLLTRYESQWGTRPLFHSLIWTGLALNHAALDLQPSLALFCWLSLPLLWGRFGKAAQERRGLRWSLIGVAFLVVFHCLWTDAPSTALALLLFFCALTLLVRVAGRVLFRDRLWLALVLVVLAQCLSAWLPAVLPMHGGEPWASSMAYSFCEAPQHSRIYSALTRCSTLPDLFSRRQDCREGVVAEDPLAGKGGRTYHGFFSGSLHGRLEQLVCLDDSVLVGMNGVVIDGRESRDGTVEFEILHPWRFSVNRAGSHMGHRIAYDEKRDALYFVPEWGRGIVRFHRETGRLDRNVKSWTTRRPPFLGRFRDSFELGQESISRPRDSVFFAEWIGGTDVYEVSLENQKVLRIFPHNNGGSVGVTVDEEYNRIYVVGLWGIAAWNLSQEKIIWKSRLGLLPRLPVIDTKNDLILVPSTVGGRITIFDRRSLDYLGSIAIGFGVRLLHVSPTQDRLYASSSRAAYTWPTSIIASKIGVSRPVRDPSSPPSGEQ